MYCQVHWVIYLLSKEMLDCWLGYFSYPYLPQLSIIVTELLIELLYWLFSGNKDQVSKSKDENLVSPQPASWFLNSVSGKFWLFPHLTSISTHSANTRPWVHLITASSWPCHDYQYNQDM